MRIEPAGELAQPAPRAGIAHGKVEVDRRLVGAGEPGGIDPHRPCIGHFGGLQVRRRAIAGYLRVGWRGEAAGERAGERQRGDAPPSRYGTARTVDTTTCRTGTTCPCARSVMSREVESRETPPR